MTIKSDIDKNYVIVSTADILKCMRDNKKNERVYAKSRIGVILSGLLCI